MLQFAYLSMRSICTLQATIVIVLLELWCDNITINIIVMILTLVLLTLPIGLAKGGEITELVGFYGERWLANFIWQLHLSWEIIIHQDHLILIRCKARRTGELWATKLSWELRIHQQNILFNTSNWLFLSKLPDQMLCCCRGVLSVHFLESYPCLVSAII